MPKPFARRYHGKRWEVYIEEEWRPLKEVSPVLADILSAVDKEREVEGVIEFRLKGTEEDEEWWSLDDLTVAYAAEQEELKEAGERSAGWIGPWPPRDKDNKIDFAAVRKAREAEGKAREAEAKPSGRSEERRVG